jgi:very-short-patch-repair endonuclease
MVERWQVDPRLKKKTTLRARELRKESTASEDRLWQALRRKSAGVRFRRQQPIGPFIVDFYCASARLAVEVDGPIHDLQQERDRDRQTLLESLGIMILRLRAEDVERDLDGVVAKVRATVEMRTGVPLH